MPVQNPSDSQDAPANLGSAGIIGTGLSHGKHSLTCKFLSGKDFRIIAIMM
jgi:hypothetical protein